jgi:hypothetical protein
MTEPGVAGVAESLAAGDFWANPWRGRSVMAYGAPVARAALGACVAS